MNTPELFYFVAILNALFGIATITLLIAQVTKAPFWKSTNKHFKKYGLHYAFGATALSTAASLWLSEIAGITPCLLCWIQRAFMYPLTLFLGLKLFKKQQYYAATLAVLAAVLIYFGVKVLPTEYMSLYMWYAFTLIFPLAVYLVFKAFKAYSDKRYAFWMLITGAIVALYHYGVQRLGFLQKTIPCSADASCSTMYMGYWGFYSIPLMALVGFGVAAFAVYQLKKNI